MKQNKIFSIILIMLVLAFLFAGCGVVPEATPVAVTGVVLDQAEVTLVVGGETATLTATVSPVNATIQNVSWSSSDKAVAIVADGVVTPEAAGTATITVKTEDGGFKATTEVIVVAETPGEDFEFDKTTGIITKYIGINKDVVIPAKVDEVAVETIGEEAFYENDLESVIIPNSVKTIGVSAFDHNNLTSVTIPDSVKTIGKYAFAWNNLTSVTIGNSVTSIEARAFYENDLESITIPDSVTSIGTRAFNNNQLPDDQAFIYARLSSGAEDKTTVVSYGGAKKDNVIIPNTVKTIGEGAFSWDKLISVTIPDSVETIGEDAFAHNDLTSVTIGNLVETIGEDAFSWNDLTSVTIPDSVTTIEAKAFYLNDLESVIIGSSVETIRERAFERNDLTSVTIPDSVTSIGAGAFSRNGENNDSNSITEKPYAGTWKTVGDPAKWEKQ